MLQNDTRNKLEGPRFHVSTPEVMKRVQIELHTDMHFTKDMIKMKMEYAGHVLRGSSDLSHLQILEGRIEGKKKVGCPIRIWMKDICERTGYEVKEEQRIERDENT